MIQIFKTNIFAEEDVKKIASVLNVRQEINKWSIDKEDIDNVLRIESSRLKPLDVIELVKNAGFYCDELTD